MENCFPWIRWLLLPLENQLLEHERLEAAFPVGVISVWQVQGQPPPRLLSHTAVESSPLAPLHPKFAARVSEPFVKQSRGALCSVSIFNGPATAQRLGRLIGFAVDRTLNISISRDSRIQKPELDHDILLGFYRLSTQQRLRVAPFANRIYSCLREQRRAAYWLDALNGSVTADNNV